MAQQKKQQNKNTSSASQKSKRSTSARDKQKLDFSERSASFRNDKILHKEKKFHNLNKKRSRLRSIKKGRLPKKKTLRGWIIKVWPFQELTQSDSLRNKKCSQQEQKMYRPQALRWGCTYNKICTVYRYPRGHICICIIPAGPADGDAFLVVASYAIGYYI